MDAAALARWLGGEGRGGPLLVVTGAGISVASGIPTFRGTDPGAVWKRDVTELGTRAYFESDPVGSWSWYLDRFDRVFGAEPNAAHHALVALERHRASRGEATLLVTQNVDTLHARAGSTALVEVHGRADRVRCARDGCEHGAPDGSLPRVDFDLDAFRRAPSRATLPHCKACGTPVRQHVLWFDETYDSHRDYQFERVLEAASRAARVLFVGTSFSVGVTDAIVRSARIRGAALLSIDPGAEPAPYGIRTIREPSEVILPSAAEALAGE